MRRAGNNGGKEAFLVQQRENHKSTHRSRKAQTFLNRTEQSSLAKAYYGLLTETGGNLDVDSGHVERVFITKCTRAKSWLPKISKL